MIEFFFDCSSPWTYLAFHNLQPLAAELNEPVHWRPVLVGGVSNTINPSVYAMRDNPVPAKWAYMLKDLQDWAREAGLKIVFPPRVFQLTVSKPCAAVSGWSRRANCCHLPRPCLRPTGRARKTFRKTPCF